MKNSAVAVAAVPVPGPATDKFMKQELPKLIPELRDHSPRYPVTAHDAAMGDFYDVLDSLDFEYGEENAHKLMRRCFDGYIRENNIREKAEADGCDVMEYLGLSESEVYALMGCEGDEEETC